MEKFNEIIENLCYRNMKMVERKIYDKIEI